jgi:hypothetical protein
VRRCPLRKFGAFLDDALLVLGGTPSAHLAVQSFCSLDATGTLKFTSILFLLWSGIVQALRCVQLTVSEQHVTLRDMFGCSLGCLQCLHVSLSTAASHQLQCHWARDPARNNLPSLLDRRTNLCSISLGSAKHVKSLIGENFPLGSIANT